MKITSGKRAATAASVDLRKRALTVWLTKSVCLTIEPGDTLRIVSRAIGEHWPGVSKSFRNRIAAYFFALGERSARNEHGRPWRAIDRDAGPDRVYLVS